MSDNTGRWLVTCRGCGGPDGNWNGDRCLDCHEAALLPPEPSDYLSPQDVAGWAE